MIKLETHCHCKIGSPCGQTTPEEVVEEYKNAGYGGIVLTNHANSKAYDSYEGSTHKQKIDVFFSVYNDFEKACIKNGIPYEISGSISFYERSEINDVLAYITLALNNDDDDALLRIINKIMIFTNKLLKF